ncbi:histidine phosphatase family protein [Ancylomarina sp.]|uniref:histidine phosphatase family protein n=1 Tax=Ancylomarina sp. TaxID=1970196 RepID=UPI003563939A
MLKSILQFIIISHFSIVVSFAQQTKGDFPFTSVKDVPELIQNELLKEGHIKIQIYLIRHAKPNLHKRFLSSSDQAQEYIESYNKAPIHDIELNKVKVDLKKAHQIYCSSLVRSQETALSLFGDSYVIVSDSIFREFELRIVRANSIVKLPLDLWKGVSRLFWLFGCNHKGIESHKAAKKRVVLAADNLEKLASQEETAILVGHGMINAAIAKELKKRGWNVICKKGHLNLGATVLQKIISEEKKNKF